MKTFKVLFAGFLFITLVYEEPGKSNIKQLPHIGKQVIQK